MLEHVRLFLTAWKDPLAAISSAFTIAAIIVGAILSRRLLKKQRPDYPRADVNQTVQHRPLCDGLVILRVTATIINKGEVVIKVDTAFTRLLLLLPCDEALLAELRNGTHKRVGGGSRINWGLLEKVTSIHNEPRIVEPGETDEIHFDFLVPQSVDSVIAFTNIRNGSTDLVWERSTIYDITDSKTLKGGDVVSKNGKGLDNMGVKSGTPNPKPPTPQGPVESDPDIVTPPKGR